MKEQGVKFCKCCGGDFMPFKTTQTACSVKCAVKLSKSDTKQKKAAKKELKDSLVTTSQLKKLLQTEINKLVRAIDFGSSCISCGKYGGKVDAGHFFSVGAWDNLRFNLMNIWGQCINCNQYNGGNIHLYRIRMESFGLLDYLHDLNVIYPSLNLSKTELLEAIRASKSILKTIELTPRNQDQRIELRKTINQQLNIYK